VAVEERGDESVVFGRVELLLGLLKEVPLPKAFQVLLGKI